MKLLPSAEKLQSTTVQYIEKHTLYELVAKHSQSFPHPCLNKADIVNQANETNHITYHDLKKNSFLITYLTNIEEEAKQLKLFKKDSINVKAIGNFPLNNLTQYESTFELLLALQLKYSGHPFIYGVQSFYSDKNGNPRIIDFEVCTKHGLIYVVLANSSPKSIFIPNSQVNYRRPRINQKHALSIEYHFLTPVMMLNTHQSHETFYEIVNELIWAFDPYAEVMTLKQCIESMQSTLLNASTPNLTTFIH